MDNLTIIAVIATKLFVWLSNYPTTQTLDGGGAYEARTLVLPQKLGPGGTLWSVPSHNLCHQMLLDPKIVVLYAFCGIKNTQKSI